MPNTQIDDALADAIDYLDTAARIARDDGQQDLALILSQLSQVICHVFARMRNRPRLAVIARFTTRLLLQVYPGTKG